MKRFSEVLHPEIVLDLRGSESIRALYRSAFSSLTFGVDGWSTDAESMWKSLDVNTTEHFIIAKKFASEKPTTYQMGKEFLNVLKSVDLDIKTKLLPERFFGYISFPSKTVSDGEEFIRGAYVFIGPGVETPVVRNGKKEKLKLIWASYVAEGTAALGSVGRLLTPAGLGDKNIIQMIQETQTIDFNVDGKRVEHSSGSESRVQFWKTVLNCVLYITSAEPDLQHLKSSKVMTKSEKKKQDPLRNQCFIPVVFVSWNYHAPTERAGSSWIDSYPRWQRCGPALSRVKLIWVKPHERHYEK